MPSFRSNYFMRIYVFESEKPVCEAGVLYLNYLVQKHILHLYFYMYLCRCIYFKVKLLSLETYLTKEFLYLPICNYSQVKLPINIFNLKMRMAAMAYQKQRVSKPQGNYNVAIIIHCHMCDLILQTHVHLNAFLTYFFVISSSLFIIRL